MAAPLFDTGLSEGAKSVEILDLWIKFQSQYLLEHFMILVQMTK